MTVAKFLETIQDLSALVDKYDNFLFDCDGVLWSGDDTIKGVVSVLEKLRKRGKNIVFVTNNATKSRAAFKEKFQKLGIKSDVDEIFSSAYASAAYIKHNLKLPSDKRVYVIGMSGIEEELDAEGVLHTGGTDPADNVFLPALDFSSIRPDPTIGAVLCGFDMHINYNKLAKAYRYIMDNDGCYFILTNDDSTFPTGRGTFPGAGSISAPLLVSTKKMPIIVGKPHPTMLESILKKKHFDRSRTVMIGDRLNTDIEFGIRGGIDTVLVLTGISTRADAEGPEAKTVPTYIMNSLGDLDSLE